MIAKSYMATANALSAALSPYETRTLSFESSIVHQSEREVENMHGELVMADVYLTYDNGDFAIQDEFGEIIDDDDLLTRMIEDYEG